MSGGGTKGFCTLGALQYMQDNNIIINSNINCYIGTSVGSIISYFLAIGYTPIEIVVYLCSNNVLESFLNNFSNILGFTGIYDYSMITKHCEIMTLSKIGYIPTLKELYENLGKKLIVCTYNLTKHIREYISYDNYPNLSCLDAIRMSSNIPFIFNECIHNGDEYIDGGIIDNFPVVITENESLNPIGIYLDDLENKNKDEDKDNESKYYKILKLINKMYNIIMIPCKEKKNNINIDVIHINVENLKIYNFSITHTKKLELFSYGYNCAKYYFDNKVMEDTKFLRDF